MLAIIRTAPFCNASSYLHCEWATEQQLLKDKRIQQKIKRFKLRQAQRAHFFADVSMYKNLHRNLAKLIIDY